MRRGANEKVQQLSLLVRNEDLEGADDLGERDALVALPLLEGLCVVDEDDEVVLLALEVDLGLLCFAASHGCVSLGLFFAG